MKRRILNRLMGLILSASVILSCIVPGAYAEEVATTASASKTTSTTSSASKDTTKSSHKTSSTTSAPSTTESPTKSPSKPSAQPSDKGETNTLEPVGKEEVDYEFAVEEQALSVTWEGNGSQQNPYLITSLSHFVAVQDKLRLSDSNKYFKLTVDLDLSGLESVAADMGYANAFDIFTNNTYYGMNGWLISTDPKNTSNFINLVGEKADGTAPTISNLTLSSGAQNTLALFGYLSSNSVIDNINFSNFNLTLTSSNANALSAVALKNDGVITGCSFNNISLTMESNVASQSTDYTEFIAYDGVGVVAADNSESGRIRNILANDLKLIIRGSRSYIGGIAAQNRGIIGGASADTDSVIIKGLKIAATSDNSYIGGIAGANLAGLPANKSDGIQNADVIFASESGNTDFSSANIVGGNYIGGIVGHNVSYIIQSAVKGETPNNKVATASNANILFNGFEYIYGAIVATNDGVIEGCSSIDVSAYHETGAATVYGGIAGVSTNTITHSFSSGTTGTSGSFDIAVGGVVGKVNSLDITIDNCYTLVKIANSTLPLGAVIGVGGRDTILDTTYWSSDASGRPASCSYTGAGVNDIEQTRKLVALHTGDSTIVDVGSFECTWNDSVTVSVNKSSFASMNELIATVELETETMNVTSAGTTDGGTKIKFNATITLPSTIGSAHFSNTITQELYISVLVTSGTLTGDGLSVNTPIQIANLAQLQLIRYAPFAHYELIADITVPSSSWTAFDFTGTLDGNSKHIKTNTRIFNSIFGNIDESHTTDAPNRGYLHDIKLQLTSAITTSIFGVLSSAAFDNISLTGTNGSSNYTITTSKKNDAAFIGRVTGNSYINNCSVDVKVWAGADNSAGFIGLLDAEVTNISNCAAKSEVRQSSSVSTEPKGCSPFIAQIDSCTGIIKDCYSSGLINLDTSSGIVFGNANYMATFENTYFSRFELGQTSTNYYASGKVNGVLNEWRFKTAGRLNSDMTTVTTLMIELPKLAVFEDAQLSDFELTVSNSQKIAIVNDANHTSYLSEGILYVPVVAVDPNVPKSTVIVKHKPTNLVARAGVTTDEGLVQDADEVFLIQSPDDLVTWGTLYKDATKGEPLRGEDKVFKLVADIDMTGYSHVPIGFQTSTEPYRFNGTFTCDLDGQGKPLYSISNLKIDGTANVLAQGLFGYVGYGASITNLLLKDPVVSMANMSASTTAVVAAQVDGAAEFDNIWIENPKIDAGKEVGPLIGKANKKDPIYDTENAPETGIVSVTNVHVYTTEGGTAYIDAAAGTNGVCVGGIVGTTQMPMTVNNCEVTDINITASQYGVGGIIGSAPSEGIIIRNCNVTNTAEQLKTITAVGGASNTTTTGAGVGGIIGSLGNQGVANSNTGNIIENCTVTGYKIESTKREGATGTYGIGVATGGIVGVAGGTIKNNTLLKCEVVANTAGGIVGMVIDNTCTLDISDCEIQGSNIYSSSATSNTNFSAGGILGYVYDAANVVTITHCLVNETSKIGNETVVQGSGQVGGIVGMINANGKVSVSYCQVHADVYSKSTANGNGSGGIVGRMSTLSKVEKVSISYCEVTSTITAAVNSSTTASMKKGEGGIIGNILSTSQVPVGTVFITNNTIRCHFSENVNYKGIIIGNANQPKTLSDISNATLTVPDGMFSGNYYSNFIYDVDYDKCELSQDLVGTVSADQIANYSSIATNINLTDMDGDGEDDDYRVDRAILPEYIVDRTPVQVFSPGGGMEFPATSTGFRVTSTANAWASQTRRVMEVTSSMQGRYVTVRALRSGKTFVYNKFTKTVRDNATRQTYTTYLYIAFPLEVQLENDFDGAGTKENPYLIYTADDLYTARSYLSSYFALANDIDMSILDEPYWLPLGMSTAEQDADLPFTGGLTSTEGNVFTIYGLNVRSFDKDKLGLFSSLEGAELSNFVIDSPKVEGLNSVGALAGYATSSDSKDTVITNVTIRQPQITGQDGVGGLIGTANSKSNGYKVIIDGCTLTCNFASEFGNISAVKNVGGILGKTANSVYDVVIKNCTVNQMNITNTTINGSTAYFAGGIAADMNGIVENPKITNSVISGMGAGGIVGTTSYKAQGIKLTITGAEVTNGTKIIATNTEPLTTVLTPAGGILAMMGNENATYTIKDCIVGTVGATTPDVTVEGYSVAAGGIGSINSVVAADTQSKQISATIDNIKTNANVKATRAYVSANQHLYNAASLIGYIGTDFSYISLTNSHAGGIVEGKVRVGGLIGSINYTTSNLANKAFASDCVITATLNIPQNDTNAKRGRVVGDLVVGDGTPFKPSDAYTTYAFNNIYYSSYPQSISQMAAVGEAIPKFGVSPINGYTNGIDAKIYNLNNVVYSNGGQILDSITLSDGQEFVIDNSNSAVKIQTTQPTLTISEGGVLGFTATADGTKNTVFEIASVAPAYDGYVSVSRDYGANTATIIANGTLKGTVDLVFTYTNGLKISIPVKTNATEGNGTQADPFIIDEPGDFDLFATHEGAEIWVRQTEDIVMPETTVWQPKNFAGHYTGYDLKTGKEVVRKITNLTINEPSLSIVGFVKTLSGSISNITFEGIQVTGLTDVGAIAGSATGEIRNCKVVSSADRNSSVTGAGTWYQSTSSGTGGLVGKTEGELLKLRISDCYVDENTVVSGNSSTAGIVGINLAVGGLIIERCESFASVTSTGLTSSIGNAASILGYLGRTTANNKTYNTNLNTISIDNCIAGGKLKSSYNAAGIIGSVNTNSISWKAETALEKYNALWSENKASITMIQNSIVSADIISDRSSYEAKIMGSCAEKAFDPATTGVQAAIKGIYYSSYPQSIAFISNTSLNNAIKDNCTDIALYLEQDGTFTSSVKYSLNPDFSNSTETMVVEHENQETVLYVKNEYSTAKIGKYSINIKSFEPLNVSANNTVTMTLDDDFINSRKLTVYSEEKCTTDVEIGLSYGLKIRSAATFGSIEGEGTKNNPYKVKTTEDLNFMAGMYFTTGRYFEQVNDINIDNSEYASGGRYPAENGGYRPIGSAEYKFNGFYEGNGYKVTNLYINRPGDCSIDEKTGELKDPEYDVGFFGYLGADAEIRNLHIELMPDGALGREQQFDDGYWNVAGGITGGVNVGGLAGSSEAKIIENCSVAYGNINGYNNVAGLVGAYVGTLGSASSIKSCFTTSSVYAQNNVVGGIVGIVNETLTIDNCFSTSYVYANNYYAGGFIGTTSYGSTVTVNNSMFNGSVATTMGDRSDEAYRVSILIGRSINSTLTVSSNIIGGTFVNVDFNKIKKNNVTGEIRVYPIYIVAYIDALSEYTSATQNNYYDMSTLGKTISGLTEIVNTERALADGSGIEIATARTSEQLSTDTLPAGFSADKWNVESGKYPYLKMMDFYSDSFSKMSSLHLTPDEYEAKNNNDITRGFGGAPSIANNLGSGSKNVKFTSTAWTKTIPDDYDPTMDKGLYGNGIARNTDVLFKDTETTTTLYKNSFGLAQTYTSSLNNHNKFLDGKTNINGYEVYDARVPSIFAEATFTSGGKTMTVTREIKVPFNVPSTGTGTSATIKDYYVYTEYQLRELTKSNSSVYPGGNSGYAGHNIYIAADIELTAIDAAEQKVPYRTISTLYNTSLFGCDHTITGMDIRATASGESSDMGVGFIKRIGDGMNPVTVQDLTFEKLNIVTTSNNVGGLAGFVDNYATIKNCAIGSSVTHTEKQMQNVDGEEKEVEITVYDTMISGGSTVGGLIGKTVGAETTITDCSSAIKVIGSNVVGGLVGDSKVRLIKNSSATGNVEGTITGDSSITRMGIGGFAGILDLAYAVSTEELSGLSFTGVGACFAAGNVDVTAINNGALSGKRYGVGGFTGVAYTSDATKANACICISFSSGTVDVKGIENITTSGNYIGVGGFAGINENNITNFYTSSAVHVNFDESASVAGGSVVAAGGIVGVSWHKFQDSYTSGLVEFGAATSYKDNCHIGGVLGYYVQGDELANSFYDSYKNNFEGLTPIGAGNNVVNGGISDNVKALTTDELCFDQYVDASKANFKFCATLSTTIWGADDSAYPYLKEFMAADVADKIRYPALLSVISVIYDKRDTSVREGKGITMAITLPTEINNNELNWETVGESANYLRNGNKVVPIRTKNTEEVLLLGVSVVDKKEFAYKEYEILCADMLGTIGNPYLIGTPEDLQSIGLTPAESVAKYGAESKNLHKKWITQINTEEEVIQETANPQIHFKFMADVDMKNTGHTVNELNYQVEGIEQDKVIEGVVNNFEYKGLDINGFGFKLQNFKDTTPLANIFDAQSELYDLVFENLDITSTETNVGIIAENRGTLAGLVIFGKVSGANATNTGALVAVNKGTITKVISDADVVGNTRTGGLVGLNEGGTIALSVVNADVKGSGNLGGVVGVNNGIIENTFGMGDAEGTANSASVGGFVGINRENAKITACYTRTNVTGKNLLAGFIGTNAGNITACYAAGKIVNNALTDSQTCMFCASNSGNVSGAIVDKAMAGNSTYKLYEHGLLTEDVFGLTTFSAEEQNYYYINGNEYPQLKAIVDLVSMYETVDGELPTEHNDYSLGIVNMLKAYSNLSSAALNTPYSQYIDSLPTESTATISSDLAVVWNNTADASVATLNSSDLILGNTAGTGSLVASVDVPMAIAETTYQATLTFNYTTGTQNKNFKDGVGSETNPYQIETAEQLASLYYYGPDPEVNYELAADIDMDTLKDTRFMNADSTLKYPIAILAGNFNGNGKEIESLVINDNQLSLFGTVTGSISNLGVLDAAVTVTGGTAEEPKLAGVLAQSVRGSITNSYANADISATGDYITVGGLVGRIESNAVLLGCVTTGKTMFEGADSFIGGVVGYSDVDKPSYVCTECGYKYYLHNLVDGHKPETCDRKDANNKVCGSSIFELQGMFDSCLSTTYISVNGNDTVYAGGIAGYLANVSSMSAVSYASDLKDLNAETPSNIGLFIGGMSDTATLEDADYDKQLCLTRTPVGSQGEATVTGVSAMTTKAMQSNSRADWYNADGLYTSPISLDGTSDKFARGLKFATTPITITIGVNAGTVSNYKDIDFTNIDNVITMSPAEADLRFFKVTDGTVLNASANPDFVYDEDSGVESAGLNITIDDTYVTRYAKFSLVRIVALDVVFNDTTGELGNNQILAALLKNKHGKKETSDVTTTNFMTTLATQEQTNLDDFAVSLAVNGFYVGAKLPQGYKFNVSAVDGSGKTLTCEAQEGEYGYFVKLESGEDVTVTINIVKDNGWGVRAIWDSLIDAIVKSN